MLNILCSKKVNAICKQKRPETGGLAPSASGGRGGSVANQPEADEDMAPTIIHCPFVIIHSSLSIVNYQLSIINCPLSIVLRIFDSRKWMNPEI